MRRVWRLIVQEPPAASGAYNMAVDEALLEGVREARERGEAGAPVLRLYGWSPPCLSLGRNQAARERCDRRAAAALGVDIVRRATGGLAVYHDDEVTYAAVLPVGELGSPRETYYALHRAIQAGLARLGIHTVLAGTRRAAAAPAGAAARSDPPRVRTGPGGGETGVCFQSAAGGELTIGDQKLVGSAQRCRDRVILQHGSVLLSGDQQASVAAILGGAAGTELAGVATVREVLGYVPRRPELVEALAAGFEAALGVRLEASSLSDGERRRAAELVGRYESPEWTWRC